MSEPVSARRTSARRARSVRVVARSVLLVGVFVAIVAPVSWERLPDFKAVVVPHPPGGPGSPPSKPGPGIDPTKGPDAPKIIRPTTLDPTFTSGAFRYMSLFGSKPPFVSTCDPVPFKIRTMAAPAKGDDLIFGALQRLANATGLSFKFEGYTTKIYKFNERKVRFSWENKRDPLWIGWATNNEVPDLGPKSNTESYAVGVGGPVAFRRSGGQMEILGGGVVMRAGEPIPNRFGPGSNEGNIMLHELGHALGLDHVQSEAEQMYPSTNDKGPDGYGPGDHRGLQGITMACPK